jgi:hypothetical protein
VETSLKVAVEKYSADYRRLGANSLWEYIREDVERCFGPLAVVVRGKLMYDSFLRSCFVKEFKDHGDERAALSLLST